MLADLYESASIQVWITYTLDVCDNHSMTTVPDLQRQLLAALQHLLALVQPTSTTNQRIYDESVKCLHTHVTLDSTVPPELGCAEAVSYVLEQAGITDLPPKGIAGTAALYQWLKLNKQFVQTQNPVFGDIIISPSGMSSKASPHGHTGIVAKNGILSNDSDTGLFMEKYTLQTWTQFFGTIEGFPVFYFHAI